MTSAAGASMTIDWVDWSAMRRRVVAPSLRPARFQGAGAPGGWHVLLPSRSVGIDLVHRPRVRVQGRRRPWPGGAERTGVRELSVPPTATVGPDDALTDMVARNAAEHPDDVGLRRQVDGHWVDVTYRQFAAEVDGVAKGLVASGVQPGDRVGLLAKTRYEWTVLDYAIWTAGAVVVPVYETSSPDQIAWILSDSGAHGHSWSRPPSTQPRSSPSAPRPPSSARCGSSRTAGWTPSRGPAPTPPTTSSPPARA